MLLCTENPDGSTNISPASSYWTLGQMLALGLLSDGQTVANLKQRPELTVNFPSPEHWRAVEAIADTTGMNPVPGAKVYRYVHVPDKFGRAGLRPRRSLIWSFRHGFRNAPSNLRRWCDEPRQGWVTTTWSKLRS